MSMTIGNTHGVNELQLQAMLTGQLKEATRLEGWEAFKNFFIKLLNHLPMVSLEDKEQSLRNIYNTIYGEETAAESAEPQSIEKLWPAVERLIELLDAKCARDMEFELQDPEVHNGPLNLVIRVDGHTLPKIALLSSPIHENLLKNVTTHLLVCDTNSSTVYMLKNEVLTQTESGVKLKPEAIFDTRHGFAVTKARYAAHDLVNMPLNEIRSLDEQIAQLEHYGKQTAALEELRRTDRVGNEDVNDRSIRFTIAKLILGRTQLLGWCQQQNKEYTEVFIKNCAKDIQQGNLFSKEAIRAKQSSLSNLMPHLDTLFRKEDADLLKAMNAQLWLAYEIADIKDQITTPDAFTQQRISVLCKAIDSAQKETPRTPLTELLNTAFQEIMQHSSPGIAISEANDKHQQADNKLHVLLTAAEKNIGTLLNDKNIPPDIKSTETEDMFKEANLLPSSVPNRTTLINRAEAVHRVNTNIIKIEQLLAKVLTTDVTDPQDKMISELVTLINSLPDSNRRLNYQNKIDNIVKNCMNRKIHMLIQDIEWASKKESSEASAKGLREASEKAVDALMALKRTVDVLNLVSSQKSQLRGLIDSAINQNAILTSIEDELIAIQNSSNTTYDGAALTKLSNQLVNVRESQRKLEIVNKINDIFQNDNLINKFFIELGVIETFINAVARNEDVWSEKYEQQLNDLKKKVHDLPEGVRKEHLITNIAVLRERITKITALENLFSKIDASFNNMDANSDLRDTLSLIYKAYKNVIKLPESTKKEVLKKRLGEYLPSALAVLQHKIAMAPGGGNKNYMDRRKDEYNALVFYIKKMQSFAPDAKKLQNTANLINHNHFAKGFFNKLLTKKG